MKTGFNKYLIVVGLLTYTGQAFAAGTIIATAIFGAAAAGTFSYVATAFAVNILASAIIAKTAFKPNFGTGSGDGADSLAGSSPNPGKRQQVPPATDNKLPVVYGTAWAGGTLVDLSITGGNQQMYYVLAICEVTNHGADAFTFGDVYYGGKKVGFGANGSVVTLTDESTGVVDASVSGKMSIYLYSNGSNQPYNTTQTAIQVMQSAGLTYQWTSTKLMTGTVFAIVKLTYSDTANIRALESTKFQIANNRSAPGSCISDYLTDSVYGAGLSEEQIDFASLNALNAYSAQQMSYTTYQGILTTQTRFKFDGVLDTNRSVMSNLQDMASCCDCLLKYNEITGQWGVITQPPSYTVAMALNDSNMVSAINITPLDISSSFSAIECKFPDKANQDSFNTAVFDLAQVAPALLYPNEPINKQSVSLPLVNDSVRAQYIANRLLKTGREDLQVLVNVNFEGIQLEAGDVVTVTNANYGWAAKLFRVNKVIEQFDESGAVTAKLTLSEYNPAVFNDVSITQFSPLPNSGIGDPLTFGSIPAPLVTAEFPTDVNPYFSITVTGSQSGVIQYAEAWYSAFASPTSSQLIFAATSEIQSSGNPYTPGAVLPAILVANIPSGNWYLFSRMVNSLGTSAFSPASAIFRWRPQTIQFVDQYVAVAYADRITGTGFTTNPRNKSFFGLRNQANKAISTTPADYRWFSAEPAFGTAVFLCFVNRTGRKFSFDTGFAGYAGGTGRFVPTQTSIFDPRLWSAFPDGTNVIDLDVSTGQLISTGTTSSGANSGEITVTNTPNGGLVASLAKFLDFGGSNTLTSPVATLTVDIYGRVVGFAPPDTFYYTDQDFSATAGQTVFNVKRAASYIRGQCFVFRNGILLDTTEYTDAGGSTGIVTFANPCALGDYISIVSMKSDNATTGVYASFTRNTATLTNASSFTPSEFTINSGYELLFLNGTIVNDQDYNITGGAITDFPNVASGLLTCIQFVPNNLGTPAGDMRNVTGNTVVGQPQYFISFNPLSFNLYSNGALLLQGTDYTTATGSYTLANTPDTVLTVLVNQSFARIGAV